MGEGGHCQKLKKRGKKRKGSKMEAQVDKEVAKAIQGGRYQEHSNSTNNDCSKKHSSPQWRAPGPPTAAKFPLPPQMFWLSADSSCDDVTGWKKNLSWLDRQRVKERLHKRRNVKQTKPGVLFLILLAQWLNYSTAAQTVLTIQVPSQVAHLRLTQSSILLSSVNWVSSFQGGVGDVQSLHN